MSRASFTDPVCLAVAALLAGGVAPIGVIGQQTGDVLDAKTGRSLLNAPLENYGVRDGGTQLMIIDVMDVRLPGESSGRSDDRADQDTWYVATNESGDALLFSGPSASGEYEPGSAADSQAADVEAFLRSLGESTGPALQLQIASGSAFRFSAEGVVVEPLAIRDAVRDELETRITRLAAGSPVTRILNAYCLEFTKGPPTLDQVFRIAEPQLQDLYSPAANILKASRQLIDGGILQDRPLDYIHSIKQWALWVREGDFSAEAFGDQFVAHARDNFREADVAWNDEVESGVRATVPERWDYISMILATADGLEGGAEWPR